MAISSNLYCYHLIGRRVLLSGKNTFPMNPLQTEVIKIPKHHFLSMNMRLQGVKNLIRMYVDKDNELKTLKIRYQKMEAEYSELISKKKTGLSECCTTQRASNHSLLLPNTSTKQIGVSEETYYDILKQLCHTTSRLNILQKASDKKLQIESWTQTDDTRLRKDFQALQERIEKEQLEMESLKKKNENLDKQLQQELFAKRRLEEKVKQYQAQLKREKELHEETKKKLQTKNQILQAPLQKRYQLQQRCSPQKNYHMTSHRELEVDGCEEDIPTHKCSECLQCYTTEEEFECHKTICENRKWNSNN